MISTTVRKGARFGRFLVLLSAAATAALVLSGCARMRQYSLDSWQGPLPMDDLRYVQASEGTL